MEATTTDFFTTLGITLQGELRDDITQEDIINTFKACKFNYFDRFFKEEPKIVFIKDNEDPIEIKDSKISVKSLVAKNINSYIEINIPKEYIYAYPNDENMKAILGGKLKGSYLIKRDTLSLKHIKTNKKGKTIETLTYPVYNSEDYLTYILPYKNEEGKIKNLNLKAHRLFGLVYLDNDDALNKDNVDHIDRIRCFCSPQNIRWATSEENQNNKRGCIGKDERQHTNEDITYLEDWIQHIKLTKAKGKDNYLKKLDVILKELNNEVNKDKIFEDKYNKFIAKKNADIMDNGLIALVDNMLGYI
jgi:hypothetical protein